MKSELNLTPMARNLVPSHEQPGRAVVGAGEQEAGRVFSGTVSCSVWVVWEKDAH